MQCKSSDPPPKSRSESWRHQNVTAQASANLQPTKKKKSNSNHNTSQCRVTSTLIQRLSTLAQKASSGPWRNQRKRRPHPV